MSNLVKSLFGADSRGEGCIGYTLEDLDRVGRLYNIEVKESLRDFLVEMGKSSGGLICDDVIHLYRPHWFVREHLLFQFGFFSEMQEMGFFEYLNKPFVFSFVSETQYYFLQTALPDSDSVYCYDSNSEVVEKTEFDLSGFLKVLAAEGGCTHALATQGDLLRI